MHSFHISRASGLKFLLALCCLGSFGSMGRVQAQNNWSEAAIKANASDSAGQRRLKAQLSRQAEAWDKAIVTKDRGAIAANMSEDFRQLGSSGELENKTSFVEDLMSPDLKINPYTVEDFEIRLYGKTALLSGRIQMSGEYKAKPFNSHYRYIDVYVQQGRQWKLVSVQVTPIKQ